MAKLHSKTAAANLRLLELQAFLDSGEDLTPAEQAEYDNLTGGKKESTPKGERKQRESIPQVNETDVREFYNLCLAAKMEALKGKKEFTLPTPPNGINVTDSRETGLKVVGHEIKRGGFGVVQTAQVLRHQMLAGEMTSGEIRRVDYNLLTGQVTVTETLEQDVK